MFPHMTRGLGDHSTDQRDRISTEPISFGFHNAPRYPWVSLFVSGETEKMAVREQPK